MRLDRVDIRNFRSIQSQTIRLEPACRVLVGINESGKTNVLRALALLDPEVSALPDDIRDVGPDEDPNAESKVIFVFATDATQRRNVYARLSERVLGDPQAPLLKKGNGELTLKEVVLGWSDLLYRVDVRDNKRDFSRWARDDADTELIGEWFVPAKGTSTPVKHKGVQRTVNEFALISAQEAKSIEPQFRTALTFQNLLNLITKEFGEAVELPNVVYWTYEEENLLPGSINLQAFAQDPSTCLPLKHMFVLAGHIDIAAAVQLAKQRKNGVVNLLDGVARATTAHIAKVWKEFKGLSVQLAPNGANIDATIKDTYNKYDLSRRSDGFKRFISFLLSVSVKAKTKELTNTLYLHDEPDTSLHPSGARYLRDELIHLSDSNYIVYSTHSIFMIDRENISRHLIVQKKDEVTTLQDVTPSNITDEEVIYNALGYSIFDGLKELNIIFEGWRDKRLFLVRLARGAALQARPVLKEVGVCHAKGVSDVGRITPMLELARRRWLILSDSDKAARDEQRKYRGEGPWLRYDELGAEPDVITSEDFIFWEAFHDVLAALADENPALIVPADWATIPGTGKVAKLRNWLAAASITAEGIKTHLERIKKRTFAELKPSHISQAYGGVLERLASELTKLTGTTPV